MKNQFTPGPWSLFKLNYQHNIYVASTVTDQMVAEIMLHNNRGEMNAETRANAKLIMTAPEMLEALQGVRAYAEEAIQDLGANVQEGGSFSSKDSEMWHRIIFAIEKATTDDLPKGKVIPIDRK